MLGAVASSVLNVIGTATTPGTWGPTAAGQSIMTMDGSDRGGILGSYVEVEAVASSSCRWCGKCLLESRRADTRPCLDQRRQHHYHNFLIKICIFTKPT